MFVNVLILFLEVQNLAALRGALSGNQTHFLPLILGPSYGDDGKLLVNTKDVLRLRWKNAKILERSGDT